MQHPKDIHFPPPDAWGIEPGYIDALGRRRDTPPEVRSVLRESMGSTAPGSHPLLLVPQGRALPWSEPGKLILEDGSETVIDAILPADLPGGFHRFIPSQGGTRSRRILVHPDRCPDTPSRRGWGWTVQLYSLRSESSWGIGDLADLRRLGRWSSNLGARFLQVNPLLAAQAVPPIEASPYFPSSRRFLNPLYLRIEEVPGAVEAAAELEGLSAGGRALNEKDLIDRDAVFRLKLAALEMLWSRFGASQEFDRFAAAEGKGLMQYAAFCALSESHGPDWRRWPREYRHPDSPAVARYSESNRDRVAFHQWLQWLLDVQLRQAAEALPLVQDLPIGFDPGGADAWAWQDMLATDVSVGAPPDEYNTQGQDWGLPPFIPHRLREADYAPFRDTLRASLRHAGGLRMDHVMGLFRLYWIPRGAPPSKGAFVRMAHEEMLAVLALECRKAGAFAVGEDLGTVEPGVRETLEKWGVLGSKVLWFETSPPSAFPRLTLATLSTHDLPTLAGLWSGKDGEEQKALGLPVMIEAMQPVIHRLKTMAGLSQKSDANEVARRVHRLLAESSSALIAASLEDALALERRPNIPGTILERPNWSLPMPIPLEAIERHPLAIEVATAMDRRP